MTEVKEKQIWKEPAFLVGIGLTVLVLGGFAYTLFCWPMDDTYASKWQYLRHAQPNEIGDTLAGVAGTLAFVWIVVTVWLQAAELREQRQEFQRMSAAQEAQAEVLEAQRRIFENEQRQRDELEAKNLMEERLRTFVLNLIDSPNKGVHWAFSNGPFDPEFGSDGIVESRNLSSDQFMSMTIDEVMHEFRKKISDFHNHLIDLSHQSVDWVPANNSSVISELVYSLQGAENTRAELSEPQRERLDRFRLDEIENDLELLRDTTELWKEASQ